MEELKIKHMLEITKRINNLYMLNIMNSIAILILYVLFK